MSDAPKDPEKKIIVDEDWKSRVEAEKEQARRQQQGATAEPSPGKPTEEAAKGERAPKPGEAPKGSQAGGLPLPPPDLTFLASSLYLQGLTALGVVPNPLTDKAELRLDHAKHTIDTLAMLQEKTEGNRTPAESEALEQMLHELRLAFVEIRDRPSAG
jgi:hypothetical protein